MGSEMCIRDRNSIWKMTHRPRPIGADEPRPTDRVLDEHGRPDSCLLYTSDAADERSSVDLGGRRIIKKKNKAKDAVAAGRKQRKRQPERRFEIEHRRRRRRKE